MDHRTAPLRVALASSLLLLAASAVAGPRAWSSGAVTVTPLGAEGAYTGFRLAAEGSRLADVSFGSLGNLTAGRLDADGENAPATGSAIEVVRGTLTFSRLQAVPTPRLGRDSFIRIHLDRKDPFPRIEFRIDFDRFDRAAWERVMGTVPFHFLALTVPGAQIFHHRGWPIPTPALDGYPLHNHGEGYGVQVRSFWSRDWTYAPPLGAYPLATAGLWTPRRRQYVAYDFHEARLTDHSEKDIATAYCWRLDPLADIPRSRAAGEFVALVWPYARPYQTLRYPEPGRHTVATHFRILHSQEMPSDADPNRFVMRFVWDRFADHLPSVPRMNDLSWLSAPYRIADFPVPTQPPRAFARITKPQWWKTDTIDLAGASWDGDDITCLYETKNAAAIAQMRQDIDFVLRYTRWLEIGGDRCCAWPKPLEGEAVDMFGPDGVETLHNIQSWQFALMLLDVARNDPAQRDRLLPYVDGALRYTRHILYTRNGYADVPTAQFCWGAGPVTSFCLRYHATFRNDPQRRELAAMAKKLAHTMLYRYLPIWMADSNPDDGLDSAFLLEPNSGISWLGAACSNEVWVVAHAVAQVYVATGDPILGHCLRGMLGRWPQLFRDELYPTVASYGDAYTERLGLYDGSAQPLGTRATFGGLWGLFERLAWPIGDAKARVLCGEGAAMAFNKEGRHTDIADYRHAPTGAFSFRLVPLGEHCRQPEPFDVAVTHPHRDLRQIAVSVVSRGMVVALDPKLIRRFPQRPDTLVVRGLRYGDTLAIGDAPDFSIEPLPCTVPRQRREPSHPDYRTSRGPFTLEPMVWSANKRLSTDWDDPTSWAGLPSGLIWRYGIPFELADPLQNDGKQAASNTGLAEGLGGRLLFVLLANATEGASLELFHKPRRRLWGILRGRRLHIKTVSLDGAVPVLEGWPPCFEWHADVLAIPLSSPPPLLLTAKGVDVLAVTAFEGDVAQLKPTFEALAQRRKLIAIERRIAKPFRELAPLFEKLSGHVAILPQPLMKSAQNVPLVKRLRGAGLLKHIVLLSPQQLVNPRLFNPERIWVALYVGGEDYWRTVQRKGEGAEALRRYMQGGGTLVSLAQLPFPFYYGSDGETWEPDILARDLGLPICGSGALDRDDGLKGVHVAAWETPPEGRKLTFQLDAEQAIVSGLPKSFPFPAGDDFDPRWRPIVNVVGDAGCYTPILTLRDADGGSYGEAAAVIDYRSGPLKGARAAYVWSSLASHAVYGQPVVIGVLRHILSTAQPPLARRVCVRAHEPITIDGKLDERAWRQAGRVPLAHCFLSRQGKPPLDTAARLLWDDEHLYIAFECDDPDVFGRAGPRDSELWEEEVVEVYLDPDGDGRDYLELEVNPRNAVIDLKLPAADQVKGDAYKRFRQWNCVGWKTAVHVDGTLANRDDTDRRWTAEMAIPLAGIAPAPKIGDRWRLQLYRIDRSKSLGEKPMYAAWSPTGNFHVPERFGTLILGSNPALETFSLYPPGSDGRPTWQPSAGTWRIGPDGLVGEDCLSDGWQFAGTAAGQPHWRDYRLKVWFKILELGGDHRDGPWIAVRHTGPDSCYALHLGSAIQLHKHQRGRCTADATCLAQAAWTPDDKRHLAEVIVKGNRITALLDGKPLLDAVDRDHLGVPPIPAGGIALSARRWSQSPRHTRVAFDAVQVELLPD